MSISFGVLIVGLMLRFAVTAKTPVFNFHEAGLILIIAALFAIFASAFFQTYQERKIKSEMSLRRFR